MLYFLLLLILTGCDIASQTPAPSTQTNPPSTRPTPTTTVIPPSSTPSALPTTVTPPSSSPKSPRGPSVPDPPKIDLKSHPAIMKGLVPIKFVESRHISKVLFDAFKVYLTTKFNIAEDPLSPLVLVIAAVKENDNQAEVIGYFSEEQQKLFRTYINKTPVIPILIIENSVFNNKVPGDLENIFDRHVVVVKSDASLNFFMPIVSYFRFRFVNFEEILKEFGIEKVRVKLIP